MEFRLAALFLLTFLGSGLALADTDKKLYVGAGVMATNLSRTTATVSGSKGFWGPVFPEVVVNYRMPISDQLDFTPTLDLTLLGAFGVNRATDGAADETIVGLIFPLSYKIMMLDLHGGLGIKFLHYTGQGGTTDLNNGTTVTTFYRPSRSSTTRIVVVDLGVGGQIVPTLRADLDTWIEDIGSARRAVSILFKLSYAVF